MDQISRWYIGNLQPYITPLIDPLIQLRDNHPWICTIGFLTGSAVIYYYASRPRNLPPGPLGLPFIGSPFLVEKDQARGFDELSKKWGDLYSFYIGMIPVVVLNSHKLIREAFITRGDDFSDRGDLTAHDVMNYTDEIFLGKFSKDWINDKKFIMKALRTFGFGTNAIEEFYKGDLEKFFDYLNTLDGESFDPRQPLACLNACPMARIAYGANYLHLEEPELILLYELNNSFLHELSKRGMRWQYWVDNTPIWLSRLLFPWTTRAMSHSNQNYLQFFYKKIEEHRRSLDRKHPRDLIDCYLIERGDDPRLSYELLACNMIATFLDSVETAPLLMVWIFLYLALYPNWQKKVQNQVDSVCGKRSPSLGDRSALSLVEATITEVGRIVTPVSMNFARKPLNDTTLNGYTIPKKSYCIANLWAANRDPEIFPRGDAFQPEAFIDEEGQFMRSEKTMIYGFGRRSCLGEQMTKNELFLLVSNTLQRYRLKLPGGDPPPSLQGQGGLFAIPESFTLQAIGRDDEDQYPL